MFSGIMELVEVGQGKALSPRKWGQLMFAYGVSIAHQMVISTKRIVCPLSLLSLCINNYECACLFVHIFKRVTMCGRMIEISMRLPMRQHKGVKQDWKGINEQPNEQ